jgi:hypothetical protein
VTFLFSDIEDSTRLWESKRADMAGAMKAQDIIVCSAVDVRIRVRQRGAAASTPRFRPPLFPPKLSKGVLLRIHAGVDTATWTVNGSRTPELAALVTP